MTAGQATKLVTAVALLAWTVIVPAAQTKPNFSGTWVSVEPKETAGEQQTVTHTATELILEHGSSGGGHRIVHQLDGKPHDTSLGQIKSTSRAEWQGDAIVITQNSNYPDGRKLEIKSTWSLDRDGNLIVEGTRKMDSGEPQKMRTVSRKK